jgi:GT2 family glycosyltransferase/glycosyltransferase involved in cell wall biosynthesis
VTLSTLTVIVHGPRGPEEAWLGALREVVAGRAGAFEVVSVPGSGASAAPAARPQPVEASPAALVDRAAREAGGDALLVAEAGAPWEAEGMAQLLDAALADGALGLGRPTVPEGEAAAVPAWTFDWTAGSSRDRDLLDELIEAAAVDADRWSRAIELWEPRAWAVPRETYLALGGLDPGLWSIGAVEELALRARAAGVPVRDVAFPDRTAPRAWPLAAPVRELLAIRNRVMAAHRSLPPAALGRELARVATLALASAWRRAGIDEARLQFGGQWGSSGSLFEGSAARRARKAGLWPADEIGTMTPFLALDAALDEIVAGSATGLPSRGVGAGRTDRALRGPAGAASGTAAVSSSAHVSGSAAEAAPCTGANVSAAAAETLGGPAGAASGAAAVSRGAHVSGGAAEAAPYSGAHAAQADLPRLSVIVVSWNGRRHLETCLSSLLASDYPPDRLEIVCVDNGSTDGSTTMLAHRFPTVRVVALPENRGFAGGNAAGAAAASGDVLVFLNNDMRVEPRTLRALAAALDEAHPCAAARVLSWDGRRIDFVRGTINFEGRGYQEHYGERYRPELAAASQTFFPNGGAFAITREAWDRLGGFDPAFFAYYEDVDLGWGLRLSGAGIRVAAGAIVYHRHGATSGRHPEGQKRFLMQRNALWMVLKRYGDEALARTFGAVLLLGARQFVQESRIRRRSAWARTLAPFARRCRRGRETAPVARAVSGADLAPGERILASAPIELAAAIGAALERLPAVAVARRAIQAARTVPDEVILPHFGRALEYASSLSSYKAAQDALVDALDLEGLFRPATRVLLITHEPLKARLSGPGVRVLEMGRALARTLRVTVATPAEPDFHDDGCTIAPYDPDRPATLRRLAEQADVLVVQGFTLTRFPFLRALHVPIVADLYCPFTVEHLEMKTSAARAAGAADAAGDVQVEAASILAVQNAQLAAADFFVCASERQRDFWLGALHTAGRINPLTYAADPSLRTLIDVVPFGLPDEAFERAAAGPPALKGAYPGIGPADRVLLWGGSLLDWQDPLTLIRAVATLAARRADLRLFFMGTRHPNPLVAPMRIVGEARALARALGVLDTHVFFHDWVPYEDRARFLRDADIGVSTHQPHLETHLSFRTRMLDYVWAGLPIVCTEGDHFADLVRQRGLGLAVPPGDPAALAAAIERLLDDEPLRERCRAGLAAVAGELRWSRVVEPLRRFCAAPAFAADRAPAMRAFEARLSRRFRVSKWVKQTALRIGVSEARFERLKRLAPVRAAMYVRNRMALAVARAGRAG